jgi:SPP1 gp7 family putative phage head morphogenesis protein
MIAPLSCSVQTTDARKRPGRQNPTKTKRPERLYAKSLRQIAEHVGELIAGAADQTAAEIDRHGLHAREPLSPLAPSLPEMLKAYAEALLPWAKSTARKMLNEVNARDLESWRSLGQAISTQLHHDIVQTPVGERMRSLLSEQVSLIQSLPRQAGERVHQLTLQGLENSTRASEISKEILRTGAVTESRALLIARTEVARTASVLTQARAEHAGSSHYRWRTAGDQDVRAGHKAMEGKICEWAHPPAVNENGKIRYHHPGQFPNCRCWPEPLLDDPRMNS